MACFSHPCLSEATLTHCKDAHSLQPDDPHSFLQCDYFPFFLTCALHTALSVWDKLELSLPLSHKVLYVNVLSKHRTLQCPHCSW